MDDEDLTTLIETVETLMDDAASLGDPQQLVAVREMLRALTEAAEYRRIAIGQRLSGAIHFAIAGEESSEAALVRARALAARIR